MRTCIIGYGSLINKTSLKRTLPDVDEVEPIYLNNYIRSWNALEDQTVTYSTTYLGIDKALNEKTNGIIFEVEESFLEILDKREFLYYREKVDIKDIEFLTNNRFEISENDNIWIYITSNPKKPSETSPLIQSYIDICISGCLEVEEKFGIKDFASNFILQTKNWSNHWVNDRIFPRAPHIHQPMAYNIDRLLFKYIPDYYRSITIE